MNNHSRRLKVIELTLTPRQFVFTWLRNAIKGRFGEANVKLPPPRMAIANCISKAVKNSLKGQPESVIEKAIFQARRDGDCLYLLATHVNIEVCDQYADCDRYHTLLLAYLCAVLRSCAPGTAREEEVRLMTRAFVEPVLILDGAISQISAENFEGQPFLFLDSASRLKEQLEMVDQAVKVFNLVAECLNFTNLSVASIRESLRERVDQQASRWVDLAFLEMLAVQGDAAEFYSAICTCRGRPPKYGRF